MTQEEAKKDKELQKFIKRRAKLDKQEAKIASSIYKIKSDDIKVFKRCPHMWGVTSIGQCPVCCMLLKGKIAETKLSDKKKAALKKSLIKQRKRIDKQQQPITASICNLKAQEHKLWMECPHKWGKEGGDGSDEGVKALSVTGNAKWSDWDQCIVCDCLFKHMKKGKNNDKES